ncbi:hypothetical protein SESBI_37142 [Sesbania bispinosa]|nr:hypothetical protein SESBI_37142 [Sesbania bispinosa]
MESISPGFRKVDPDRWEFANEGFLRGKKQLLKTISRRKSVHVNGSPQPSQVHNSPVGAYVEVGKFGLDEEVERLKRDKNVLMQELVRLRQQQQVTDNQLQSVGQRVQAMEQRQQQMMSFLAKAVQSPGFLAQFVQQQNESNRHITGGNKKRRLHRQEEDSSATNHLHNALDGRVVRYQTSTNESATALLHQILQTNNSGTMESSIKSPDAFLIDNVSSAIATNSISSTQVSNVTLSVVPPISVQTCMGIGSKFPVDCMPKPNAVSEVQSSPAVLTDCVKTAEFSELTVHNCQDNVLDFCKVQGIETESSLGGADTGNVEEIDMIAAVLDGMLFVEADHFSSDAGGISKLPGINDEFWELFVRSSGPLTGDTEEINCSSLGCGLTKDQGLPSEKENEHEKMEKIQHVDHLTQQMGILATES